MVVKTAAPSSLAPGEGIAVRDVDATAVDLKGRAHPDVLAGSKVEGSSFWKQ